jgi:hypothetical protein
MSLQASCKNHPPAPEESRSKWPRPHFTAGVVVGCSRTTFRERLGCVRRVEAGPEKRRERAQWARGAERRQVRERRLNTSGS